MVNKIILAVLLLPSLCFSQNRLFDKSMSRYELNLNATPSQAGLSLSGTYSLTEEVKALVGVNYLIAASHYNTAPYAGIMVLATGNRNAPFFKVEAGPSFSFARGSSPGLYFKAGGGLQYALTGATGINLELFYMSLNYSREKILLTIITDPTGTRYHYSAESNKDNAFGISFGLNYRFGNEKEYLKSNNTQESEKSFLDKVSINAAATMNITSEAHKEETYPGFNISAVYAIKNNFNVGAGFEYTKYRIYKYYSPFITGITQTSSKNMPLYLRLAAGANLFGDNKRSPGAFLSAAAGLKYNISERFGLTLEAAYKNMGHSFNTFQQYAFEGILISELDEYDYNNNMVGLSLGTSIRLGN